MNLFDNTKVPYQVPTHFVRGDYVAWRNSSYVQDYPPASYTLKYNFRKAGESAGEFLVTGVEDAETFLFEIASATSAEIDAGSWFFDLYVIRDSDSERLTLASGIVRVLANKAEDPDDPRSLPRRMVHELEQLLLDRTVNRQIDQTSFDNGETSASRDIAVIERQLKYWRRRLASAINKDRARRGLPHSGYIQGRF